MALSKILPASQEQFAGARNLIINGAMQVAQRGTSTTDSNGFGVDRFKGAVGNMDDLVTTYSQSTTAPDGFSNSLKVNIDTAETALAADETLLIQHKMEGQNLQHLKKGTSSANSVTVSFWVRSNKTGTYIVELEDIDNGRHIGQSYTVSSSNTWEYKTHTFVGDTTDPLGNDNGNSLTLNFWLMAGSNYSSGTLQTSWGDYSDADRAAGQVNLGDTANNNWHITGIQLEVGETATPFEHRSFQDEITRCKRYYQKSFPYGTAPFNNAGQGGARWDERTAVMPPNSYSTSTYIGAWCHLSVPMRATPTTTQYNTNTSGTSGSYLNDLQNSGVSTSYSITATSHNTEKLHYYVGGISNQGNTFGVNWEADAEL